MFHRATALPDGRILITGGSAKPGQATYTATEIYDPASGVFTPAAPMQSGRNNAAAIALRDGRILVAGGYSPNATYNTAEIYDPATGQWSATGSMNVSRFRASAIALADGRVMVVDSNSQDQAAEIYDPATGQFTLTGNMVEKPYYAGYAALPDGRVLKVGGENASGAYTPNAELWDPATNKWTATGPMNEARQFIVPVTLPDGKVLVAGGRNSTALSTTEIYDPATGVFTAGASLPMAVWGMNTANTLANGDLLFTSDSARQMMRYQAASGTWNLTGPQRSIARDAAVARLPDGNVLIAGGAASNDATTYAAVWDQACASQMVAVPVLSQSVDGDGGVASFTVTAAPGCRVEAANLPSWLTSSITGPQPMPESGSMVVSFTAQSNQSNNARSASFLLGNTSVSVSQAVSPTCPWSPYAFPNPISFGRWSTSGYFKIQAPATCSWNITSLPSFISVSGPTSGTGTSPSIAFTAPANNDPAPRSGSGQLVAMGQTSTFTFTQDGNPCPTTPTVSLSTSSFAASGGSAIGTVTAAATCPWSVTAPSWASITAGASGTGNGSFTVTVPANTSYARSGSGVLTAPGISVSYNLSQAASPCTSWTISPTSASIPAAGGSGSFTVNAGSTCNWSLSALPSWLSLTSAASGTGNGTISYTAAANTGAVRSATASLSGAGPTLSVSLSQASTQAPACSTAIVSGTPVNGYLKSMGCPAGARGSSYYTDRYTFSGTAGKVATIAMSSSSFDTYLYLRDPAGNVVRSDDDGGGGTNSRISYTLPSSGTYTIESTSYGSYSTGAYTLSFTQ